MIDLPKSCDVVIIGGGITGAGIYHETARMGLKTVLVEQHDFAWGTSSRSSKLIHGGLRYLKEGHLALTRDAVKERERLLIEAPGLVTPIAFLLPIYKDHGPGRWTLEAGLSLYDLLAQKRRHRFLSPQEMVDQLPFIQRNELIGGYEFWDAQVDDARLVLRLIAEGIRAGGTARNYTTAVSVDRDDQGHVCGVTLQDSESHETHAVETQVVFNATGCWADRLHPQTQLKKHLRPLRGSHLFFPTQALPVKQAVSFTHPLDHRAMFIIPWEGVVLVGTTDLDHTADLSKEPTITLEEIDYLLEGVHSIFPSLGLTSRHCLATIAGLRPIISSGGNRTPSEESREHDIWVDHGLITIAGGKLTTYRRIALDALKSAQPFMPAMKRPAPDGRGFESQNTPEPPAGTIQPEAWQRLWGRYGPGAHQIVEQAQPEALQTIPGTPTLWAELPYVIKHEAVRHLSDLLLRRVRLGLLLPEGGRAHLARLEQICRPELGWDRRKWRREAKTYIDQWQRAHGLPWLAPSKGPWQKLWSKIKQGIMNLRQNTTQPFNDSTH